MIEFIFTIDYEIYGNGKGSLMELVYEPAQRLKEIFQRRHRCFVIFIEVAELEMIEIKGTDPAINLIRNQIREFYNDGFELGLHIHPQWYNAQYEKGKWRLDYNEYNLCMLPHERIVQIVNRSLTYLRNVLNLSDFTPLSFRAGNWLFQPTEKLASVLSDQGIKIDSSVFKGGLQLQHKLDYRPALKNGYYWKFTDDVTLSDSRGTLLEIPIYTQMVLFWRMCTTKRISMQRKVNSGDYYGGKSLYRFRNFLRFRYPLKLDFCRMTIYEFTKMINTVIREDQQDPGTFRPIVAIGHTKDLIDYGNLEPILEYLNKNKIRISTFTEIYNKCT